MLLIRLLLRARRKFSPRCTWLLAANPLLKYYHDCVIFVWKAIFKVFSFSFSFSLPFLRVGCVPSDSLFFCPVCIHLVCLWIPHIPTRRFWLDIVLPLPPVFFFLVLCMKTAWYDWHRIKIAWPLHVYFINATDIYVHKVVWKKMKIYISRTYTLTHSII